MSQRTLAGLLAVPLVVGLWVAAILLPVPYVTYQPGITVDVLAESGGEEIIQVEGHQTYRDSGELRMTTVYVTQPEGRLNLLEAMSAWISDEDALYPHDAIYRQDETQEESKTESAVAMVSSQDSATAVALAELGYDVQQVVEVLNVRAGLPADGRLKVGDVLVSVGGRQITTPQDVVDAVDAAPVGEPLSFVVERQGKRTTVEVVPKNIDGDKLVGITPGPGYTFPFEVDVNIPDSIGGPSAGLMFSLGIYDTLTPGSLTGDQIVAGTGTIDAAGRVGPIGGIEQKVVAARKSGAKLFLVPPGNCADALDAPNDDMRLVRAETMHEATEAIKAWVVDPDATLPTCSKES